MLQNNEDFKKLELKRDVCRLVLDIHTYLHIRDTKDSEYFRPVYKYIDFINDYNDWQVRLESILSRAQNLGCNPNYLNYDKELYKSIGKLLEEGTEEEKAQIRKIDEEMNMMIYICRDPKTLSEELIHLFKTTYERHTECPIDKETLEKYISILIKRYTTYKPNSEEYNFLLDYDGTEECFISCFESYFLSEDIEPEAMTNDFSLLISEAFEKNNAASFDRLKRAIPKYGRRGIQISEKDMIYMLEAANPKNMNDAIDIMRLLRKEPQILPFTVEEFLASLFDELINKKDSITHYEKSLLFKKDEKDDPYTVDRIVKYLYNMFLLLSNLCGDGPTLTRLLANKVALLDDGLDISSRLCENISNCKPDYSSIFITEYFAAADNLQQKRSDLVMTLKEVSKKKAEQNN